MRTTLTLDDDVAAKLREESRRTGRSFKEVVNSRLRLALTQRQRTARSPFVVAARPLSPRRRLAYDNVAELLEVAEGPEHR
jgi:hypothetical protein